VGERERRRWKENRGGNDRIYLLLNIYSTRKRVSKGRRKAKESELTGHRLRMREK